MIRALHVTHGEAGWHVHVHALVLLHPGATPAPETVGRVFERWQRYVAKTLGPACVPAPEGLDWRPVETAGYVAEMEIGEPAPESRARSPWQIAAGAAAGDATDIALWLEWVGAMKNIPSLSPARQLAPVIASIREARQAAARANHRTEQVATQDHNGLVPPATTVEAAPATTEDASASLVGAADTQPPRTITRELVAAFPPPIWDELLRTRGAVLDLRRRALEGGLQDVVVGVARHLFGNAADGAPEPCALAWVLRMITPPPPPSVSP